MADPVRSGPLVSAIDPYVTDGGADAKALRARTQSVNRGAARAAVLGVNDGLVTNLSLIIAMAGASASQSAVRLAGFASLVAGRTELERATQAVAKEFGDVRHGRAIIVAAIMAKVVCHGNYAAEASSKPRRPTKTPS